LRTFSSGPFLRALLYTLFGALCDHIRECAHENI
jgi:hypothetical protein